MSFAFAEHTPAGAGTKAMGGAGVATQGFWNIHNNQAGIAFEERCSFGAYYESGYLLKEISKQVVAAVVPMKSAVFGADVSRFGNTTYSETKIGLGMAKAFTQTFSLSMQFDYLSTRLGGGYGSRNLFTVEAGAMVKAGRFVIGGHLFNPLPLVLSESNEGKEFVPNVVTLGAAYRLSEKYMITAEVTNDKVRNFILRTGLECKVVENLAARVGISTEDEVLWSFGVGVHFNRWEIDVAASQHGALGFSPQVSLIGRL